MSGTLYGRSLTVSYTLDVESFGHYHDFDYSMDGYDFKWHELESPLADETHIGDVASRLCNLLDQKQPDSFTNESYEGGKVVVRPGITVWHAPPDLPYGPNKYAYRNTLHDRDGVQMDAHSRAHRNAHADAEEI